MNDSFMYEERQRQLAGALAQVTLPQGIEIRPWTIADFSAIQRISSAEGWPSPTQRPADTVFAWPALVAVVGETVIFRPQAIQKPVNMGVVPPTFHQTLH